MGWILRCRCGLRTKLRCPMNRWMWCFPMALLHHLDLPRVREEIRRILRPGGLFVLKGPIRFSRTMGYLRRLFPAPTADISDYEHPMTRDEVSLVSQGFEVVAQRAFRLPFVPVLTRFNVGRKQIRSSRSMAAAGLSRLRTQSLR